MDSDFDPQVSGRKRKSSEMSEKSSSKRRRESDELLKNLTAQVNNIQQFLSQRFPPQSPTEIDDDVLDIMGSPINPELYEPIQCPTATTLPPVQPDPNQAANLATDQSYLVVQPPAEKLDTAQSDVSKSYKFSVNTVLKEPAVPKSLPDHLEKLKLLQHFESENWSDVRYSDVQKRYSSTPGFVELSCNDELKPFDTFSNISHTERGFSAITLALMKQNEAFERGFHDFITWITSVEMVDTNSIQSKIEELFSQGEYQRISSDLLQMACGHRADMVQQRRDCILKSVKDKFVRASLRQIPPSCDRLFQADLMTTAIEKNGGMSKIFWPQKTDSNRPKKAAQFDHQNKLLPAQGNPPLYPLAHSGPGPYQMPAQGYNVQMPSPYFAPTQGGFLNRPVMNFQQPTQGKIFRPRTPKTSQEGHRPSFRSYNSENTRGRNKRRF